VAHLGAVPLPAGAGHPLRAGFLGRICRILVPALAGVSRERVALVPPAIDLARFEGLPTREGEWWRRGWEGRLVILSVGRLVERSPIKALARQRGV